MTQLFVACMPFIPGDIIPNKWPSSALCNITEPNLRSASQIIVMEERPNKGHLLLLWRISGATQALYLTYFAETLNMVTVSLKGSQKV
jgi:hypothetical protein